MTCYLPMLQPYHVDSITRYQQNMSPACHVTSICYQYNILPLQHVTSICHQIANIACLKDVLAYKHIGILTIESVTVKTQKLQHNVTVITKQRLYRRF